MTEPPRWTRRLAMSLAAAGFGLVSTTALMWLGPNHAPEAQEFLAFVWLSFAAVVVVCLALAVATYLRRRIDEHR